MAMPTRIAAAIAEQAGKLDQLIFAGWTHQPAQTVAEGLVEMVGDALGAGALPYVFFSDSGSTCVEVALKMALGHWSHRGEGAPRAGDAALLPRRHHRRDERGRARRLQRRL
jgi:adenosylmethionine-8-amino-7-oxononanoate aminotransferase